MRRALQRSLPNFYALLALLLLAPGTPIRAQAHTIQLPGLVHDDVVLRHWPEQSALARRVLGGAVSALPALPADILARGDTVTVLLAPDEARFRELTGGRAPEWGAGVAFPAIDLIVLPGYASGRGSTTDLARVLRHELAHVALHRHLDGLRIPRWFDEGYATWSAGQLDPEADWLLRVAFLTNRAPSLDSLSLLWPARETDARIAYLLSASTLRDLERRGGEPALRDFLEQWRTDGSMEQALRSTYSLTLPLFERYWSRQVRKDYGWLRFLAQGVVLWTIAGAFVLAMFLIRRRRDRLRLARLRSTEIPDDPAYWLANPPEAALVESDDAADAPGDDRTTNLP